MLVLMLLLSTLCCLSVPGGVLLQSGGHVQHYMYHARNTLSMSLYVSLGYGAKLFATI